MTIGLRAIALADLLRRYRHVFRSAWAVRHELAPAERLDHELAFLPASLELAERPAHPAARWTMTTLSCLILASVVLIVVGRLDIVVTANGKLVPSMRVKTVQPAVTGVVRRILVKDGQHVAKDDLLVELDPTQAAADESKTHSARVAAELAKARAEALLAALAADHVPALGHVDGATSADYYASARMAEGAFREFRDQIATAEATLRQKEAELESTSHQIEKLQATAPLARQQANSYRTLAAQNDVPRTDFLEKESNALQLEHELAAQISHAQELREAIAAQRSEAARVTAQFQRDQLEAREKAVDELALDANDETKAVARRGLMSLSASTAGTIQQLSIHTVGGVVSAAQSLMEIVPDDSVEIEAMIENKDVGFIKDGQSVTVKIDAFPYTRYGTLTGTVLSVATDSVPDRRNGLGFVAHIRLPSNRMSVDGASISLTPGMTATVEIRTGRRSLAAYFLDPLIQTTQESLHER